MTPLLIAFPGQERLGRDIADALPAEFAALDLHRFPDGESLVTLPADIAGRDIVLLATLHDPDRLALPLRFAAAAARRAGARRVGLIAPYLAYMRQDRQFAPGQAVSARLFARFLEETVDWLVTVDPHLHRIPALERLFAIPARQVAAAPSIADWIAREVPDAVLLGPDSESRQWVARVAALAGRPFEVLQKHRSGDRDVEVGVPASGALAQGTPVILDDIAASGRTMVGAVARLRAAGARSPVCIAIHAVFAGGAHDDIISAGAARIVTTDTIPHASNGIALAPAIAKSSAEILSLLDLPALEGPIFQQREQITGTDP